MKTILCYETSFYTNLTELFDISRSVYAPACFFAVDANSGYVGRGAMGEWSMILSSLWFAFFTG